MARPPVVVIASHLPGEGHYPAYLDTPSPYDVRGVLCETNHDYWQGLADVWESNATIINIEHDMEATHEHVEQLLACPHPACSWAYQAHWFSTHLFHDVWAARNGQDGGTEGAAQFIGDGTEWAQQSAIGLVKITAQARIGPLERRRWSHVEISVENATQRPWHMHWQPVLPHHHW